MEDRAVTHAQPLAWLNEGVLAQHAAQFRAYLEERRYAPQTRQIYLCCIAHFAHWMAGTGFSAMEIDEAAINRFLGEHLPRCACPRPVRRDHRDNRSALTLFLKVLRAGGQTALSDEADHISQELCRFDHFMTQAKGLAASTRRRRVRLVGRFLTERFGSTSKL